MLVRKCGPNERWSGLWDFPRVRIEAENERNVNRELVRKVRELIGIQVRIGERLTTIKHGVTRFRITLDCFVANVAGAVPKNGSGTDMNWVAPEALGALPLSTTGRRLAKLFTAEPR